MKLELNKAELQEIIVGLELSIRQYENLIYDQNYQDDPDYLLWKIRNESAHYALENVRKALAKINNT